MKSTSEQSAVVNDCYAFIEQESRAVAGNPRDAAVIFDP